MRAAARLAANPRALTAHGADHVPPTGPVVLAVRHYHHLLDGVGLLAQARRPLHILIGLDWIAQPSTRLMMEGLAGACAWPVTLRSAHDRLSDQGVDRPGPRAFHAHEVARYQQRAHRQCIDLLGRDRVLVIFPEGFPVIDPHTARAARRSALAPFKSGFARVAIAAARRRGMAIPVVPVGIRPDAYDDSRLAFVYGAPQQVTAATAVDALIAQTRAAVAQLSV